VASINGGVIIIIIINIIIVQKVHNEQ